MTRLVGLKEISMIFLKNYIERMKSKTKTRLRKMKKESNKSLKLRVGIGQIS